jgi:hypothetical protein
MRRVRSASGARRQRAAAKMCARKRAWQLQLRSRRACLLDLRHFVLAEDDAAHDDRQRSER